MTDFPHTEQPKELTDVEHMNIVWNSMSDAQRQYVIARLLSKSDAEACRKAELTYSTVQAWPTKKLIDEYIDFQRRETLSATSQFRGGSRSAATRC